MTFTCYHCGSKVDVIWDSGREDLLSDYKGNLFCSASCFNRRYKTRKE